MPLIFRELVPGAPLVFDCERLRASLTPSACAANFIKVRCLSCVDCAVGRDHADGVELYSVRAPTCLRCDRRVHRLVRDLCISCYNRELEVLRGINARGSFPSFIAESLFSLTALVGGCVKEIPRVAARLGPGEARIWNSADGAVVQMVSTGAAEFRRWLARRHPSAVALNVDVRTLPINLTVARVVEAGVRP